MAAPARDARPDDPAADAIPARMLVRVRAITSHGPDINSYEIVDPAGGDLPPFEAGSHIDVSIPRGNLGLRQYSLCGDPQDRSHYLFTVLREMDGRGGSRAVFEQLQPGTDVTISRPRNNFALRTAARHHLLLAGGIGITPMISMIHQLKRQRRSFTLHYCARSEERAAFLPMLRPLVAEGLVFLHWDGGNPSNGLNIENALKAYVEGMHLYYCGPAGFMRAAAAASAHWPAGTTHREYFSPSVNELDLAASRNESADAEVGFGPPFRVKIASTGEILDVPSDKSLLNVLREHGVQIETQCELGVCGTCRTRYLEGQPDHMDFVLDENEREREMMVCCSRSASPLLVLDL